MLDLSRLKLIHQFAADEIIVGMTIYKDLLLVATSQRVFQLVDGVLMPLVFVDGEKDILENG